MAPTLDQRQREPRYPVMVSEHELRAIIQAVHKDRDWSPEPNIMRPTERDVLVHRLRDLLNAISPEEK